MIKHLRLLLVILFITGCSLQPDASPSPTSTVRPTSSPTATSMPTSTPTQTPIPEQLYQELETVHMVMFAIQFETELLAEAARRVDAGELERADALSIFADRTQVFASIYQNTEGMTVLDALVEPWTQAWQALDLVTQTFDQWSNELIDAEEVLTQIQEARQSAASAMESSEQTLAQIIGFDASELRMARENTLASLLETAFEPTQEELGCGSGVQGEVGVPAGQIAFVSTRDGNPEIYVINVDGSAATRLTDDAAGDFAPAWSPDGARIAFYSERDGNAEIYVMNADGSGLTRLTHNPASDYAPSWSPDGTRIAFHSHRYGLAGRIFVMNADGSGVTRLTDPVFDDWSPDWSPDGTQIMFNSSRGPSLDVWVMNADGSSMRQLTDQTSDEWWPDWSPDGTRIAFHSDRDGNFEIYVMNADGSGQIRLTDHPSSDYDPSWSPDSAWIAFTSDRGNSQEVCIIGADGAGLWAVTSSPAGDWAPAWRP